MGASGSKSVKQESEKEEEDGVIPCPLIGYDEFGNLSVLIHAERRDQDDEMMRIMNLDKIEGEDEKPWFIMDTVWVQSWLCYVYLEMDTAPCPGPCRNDRLLEKNKETGELLPKARPGMIMAVKERAGDYRRVTEEVWREFQKLYPGSGPEISTFFVIDEEVDDPHKKDGLYDTSSWTVVLDAPKAEVRVEENKRLLSLDNVLDNVPFFKSSKNHANAAGAGGGASAGSSSSTIKTDPNSLKLDAAKSIPQENFLGRRASNNLRSPVSPSSGTNSAVGGEIDSSSTPLFSNVAGSPPQDGIALASMSKKKKEKPVEERRTERFYNEVFFDEDEGGGGGAGGSVPIGNASSTDELFDK